MEGKYIILLKFNNLYWKPYFDIGGKIHCFDYEYAKEIYDKLCKNYKSSKWLLMKIENANTENEEFCFMEEE